MNRADAVTLFRTILVFPIAYAILAKFSPVLVVIGIIVMFVLDAIDGFFAINTASRGKIGIFDYIRYASGDKKLGSYVEKLRPSLKKQSKYGARIDVAGDRATEYIFWIIFTYVGILPLWLLFIIVLRHSFVDAFMGAKGTSSKMKSTFARVVYGSKAGRFGVGALKAITFSYLVLVYVLNAPAVPGYLLVALLVAYIMLRGIAEIYESFRK
ncbi:MAG: hypothetical protein M1528_03280 [Candidatus Marsarchaeota archaeon]|jgi:phosphatidylglycerophosphate synthase|nr:hypothetical protein [Candidatus Marsarchaeota archaeon]MCL5115529.1 hypothetical protein [Candidatus Marsarchaeota archaeon]